jgi:hypothetical protein
MGARKQYERTIIKIWEETTKKQASNQLIRSHRIIWSMPENKHLETHRPSNNLVMGRMVHFIIRWRPDTWQWRIARTWYMTVKNSTTRSSIRQYNEGRWMPQNHPVQNNVVRNMLNGAMGWYDEGEVSLTYQFDDVGHNDNSSSANCQWLARSDASLGLYCIFFWTGEFFSPFPLIWAEIRWAPGSNPGGRAHGSWCWPSEQLACS